MREYEDKNPIYFNPKKTCLDANAEVAPIGLKLNELGYGSLWNEAKKHLSQEELHSIITKSMIDALNEDKRIGTSDAFVYLYGKNMIGFSMWRSLCRKGGIILPESYLRFQSQGTKLFITKNAINKQNLFFELVCENIGQNIITKLNQYHILPSYWSTWSW